MKIIFLDFDGVLNHEQYYVRRQEKNFEGYCTTYPQSEFDPETIKKLNYIINETGAKVVVSSSWRHGRTITELQNLLESVGFIGEIIDITPSFNHDNCLRGNEILEWIKTHEYMLGKKYHEYENYVILDDDSDMLYWQKDNFLHIDRYVGITNRDAFRAIHILNKGRGSVILD